jgi:hypothetical protein
VYSRSNLSQKDEIQWDLHQPDHPAIDDDQMEQAGHNLLQVACI